jgi:concentrative nucleoside transporter, CNT family
LSSPIRPLEHGAIAQGTREGVELLVNVTAMLIVVVALVALANRLVGFFTSALGMTLSIEQVLGWAFAPMAWALGILWSKCAKAGTLLGVKTVLNELISYLQLAKLGPKALSERSRLILTYALCGFANLGSLGIMIGGMAAMVPARRAEIVSLGAKTLISGTLATLMTAAVVGAMTPACPHPCASAADGAATGPLAPGVFWPAVQPDWPTPSSFGKSASVATVQLGWPGSRSARAP